MLQELILEQNGIIDNLAAAIEQSSREKVELVLQK